MAGFSPHEGLGAPRLIVAFQPQRPQGLELPGGVRRELGTCHAVARCASVRPHQRRAINTAEVGALEVGAFVLLCFFGVCSLLQDLKYAHVCARAIMWTF